MGYTTDFVGKIQIDKPLTELQEAYINAFSETRRMRRDVSLIKDNPKHLHNQLGLGLGVDGEYFVDGGGYAGQDHEDSIIDYNSPPKNQAGLWCKWEVVDRQYIQWSGMEKFYYYVEWMEYIINNFLEPWGYTCNGDIQWQGEDTGDIGKIVVKDNIVSTQHVTFKDDGIEDDDEDSSDVMDDSFNEPKADEEFNGVIIVKNCFSCPMVRNSDNVDVDNMFRCAVLGEEYGYHNKSRFIHKCLPNCPARDGLTMKLIVSD